MKQAEKVKAYWNLRRNCWSIMVKRKVVDHEGRHRATVAKELGIEKVPVFIYTGNYTRTPSWTEEDHDVVDNLKFDREG